MKRGDQNPELKSVTYSMKDSRRLTVRLQEEKDLEESLGLIDSVAREGLYLMEEGVEPARFEWTRKKMEKNGDEVLFIVAVCESKIVGNLDLVRYGGPKTEHLRYLDMAVADGFRSLGVGTSLMDYAVKWARDKGLSKIILDVFSTNERGIGLYRKFGFEIEGVNRQSVLLKGKMADIVHMGLFL